ncbi:hypothetical protein Pmani_020258 [Petrolisthes manimaculis]|uniref:Uncharacterized protein n=1 Tax=Petrolisthes manimaculis TaxID=1843537 RepID=A0AAE1U2S2_9EUCA|nr:hypothetical protein Pmani_020258 [Petrolisthes manimaculis]
MAEKERRSPGITTPQHQHLLLLLSLITTSLLTHHHAAGQTCGATQSYEKVSMVAPEDAATTPLYTSPGDIITHVCLERCQDERSCAGVMVQYGVETCYPVVTPATNTNVVVHSSSTFTPVDLGLRPIQEPTSFFQKICLRARGCGKAWMLERVVGFEIEGYDDLVLQDITDRLSCADLCLSETNLKCRSAEYDESTRQCRLSRQDRRTQPLSFRPTSPLVHYIENQCAGIPSTQHCEYEELPQQDIRHPDAQYSANSQQECQEWCEQETSFNCRSFTWYGVAGVCQLSGDDMTSAGPSAVVPTPGATFYQRTTCLDRRLFTRDYPNTCLSRDKGLTDTSLTIKFRDPECGVMDEGEGVFSNVVVVQHHPVIQRRGDRAIKVLCLFQTANKTVSDSFNFIVDSVGGSSGGVATAIVNATAPSPRIRLRIVDRLGRDINGARLGEELYLRLDLDDDSVYGILARNLVAKSGDNSDSIVLLDERGCPADPSIFPSLQPLPGTNKSLQGKFEAFKFSEDQVVRFQVNVQFCLEECRPARCGPIVSYGKRRRRRRSLKKGHQSSLVTLGGELTLVGGQVTFRNEDDEEEEEEKEEDDEEVEEIDPDSVYHEMPLQKEIIVDSSTIKPLRRGLLPEETDARRLAQLVCTSREVLIAIVVSAAILQICIILVAIMCVYARKRKHVGEPPMMSSSSNNSSGGGGSGDPRMSSNLTLTRGGYRSPYPFSSSENSANTLKSLRTSLRD